MSLHVYQQPSTLFLSHERCMYTRCTHALVKSCVNGISCLTTTYRQTPVTSSHCVREVVLGKIGLVHEALCVCMCMAFSFYKEYVLVGVHGK